MLTSKIAIIHAKGELKGGISKIPIKAANICNILARPPDWNGLIVVKLKWDLNYRGYIYSESLYPRVIYQASNFLKTHNKFYKDISI